MEGKKALLIYPKYPDTFWSFSEALKFIGKRAAMPPLGLLTVSALLPGNWEKKLIDLNIEKLQSKDIEWADYILISAMIVQKKSMKDVLAECKKANPKAKIIAGGPLFTLSEDEYEEVDHYVLNEAEVTLPQFIRSLKIGNTKRIYSSKEFSEIKASPMPDWELIKSKLKYYGSVSLQFSRGCPFECEFCDIELLAGKIPRYKSAGQIIRELDYLYSIGYKRSIFFSDDNFIANARELKKYILPALINWRRDNKIHGLSFYTQASVNLADDEKLMDLMLEAGFTTVFIGIESVNKESLLECNKKQNIKVDLLESVKKMQQKGFQVQAGFIVGFDNDPPTIFEDIIEFIQKSGIVTAMAGPLQALKGTKLYQRLQSANRLSEESSGDNTDGSTNIIPLMGIDTLKEGYKKIIQEIYDYNSYYERVKTFLKNYQPAKIKTRVEFMHIMAFFRAMIQLGIIGKERVYYWKLLLWTFFNKPRFVPLAITLAIFGRHFYTVANHITNI